LRAAGVTAPIIGSQAFDSTKFIDIAGPAAERATIIDSFNRQRDDAALKAFFEGFKAKAGYEPEGVAAITYSAIKLMADAINRAGSADPAKVRDALAKTQDFPTFDGTLHAFNKLHEIIMPISINTIKGGKFTPSGEITDLAAFAPPEK
jgi:branched-chain amino acid transport system substrate-binding protein